MTKLRIVVAEDHATVREGLRLIVDAQPDMEVVGEAADGRAAVQQVETLRPDIVLMDVSMPRMNGLAATEALQRSCPQVKVLTLTRHVEPGYVRQLLRAGAAGYVLKQSSSADLLRAIRAIAGDGGYVDPAVAGELLRDLHRRGSSRADGEHEAPTAREGAVLRLIALGHSNKDIAAQLDVSVKTVETHKANVTQKLGLQTRVDIVRYAIVQGWLQDG